MAYPVDGVLQFWCYAFYTIWKNWKNLQSMLSTRGPKTNLEKDGKQLVFKSLPFNTSLLLHLNKQFLTEVCYNKCWQSKMEALLLDRQP